MKWICTNKTINAMMASPQTANVESESENASVLVSQFDMKGNSSFVPYSLGLDTKYQTTNHCSETKTKSKTK